MRKFTLPSTLTAVSRLLVGVSAALILSGCGSSSSDDDTVNGNGNGLPGGELEIPGVNYRSSGDIDASLYIFPEASTTLSYGIYDVGFGESTRFDTYSETWVRDGNEWTVDGDFWSSTYTLQSDRILTHFGSTSIALPRFANNGDIVMQDEYIEERAFGPLSDYTLSPGGDLSSRTIADAMITIEHDVEYQEVIFSVFERGVGLVAEMLFWDCPDNITLSPDTEYTEICAQNFELELLDN